MQLVLLLLCLSNGQFSLLKLSYKSILVLLLVHQVGVLLMHSSLESLKLYLEVG